VGYASCRPRIRNIHRGTHARRSIAWPRTTFLGLVLNNVLLFVDFAFLPNTDLALFKTLAGTIGMLALVYGLIWEAER